LAKFHKIVFHSPLRLEYLKGNDWLLLEDYKVTWVEDGHPQEYTVKAGLVTDRSSIPQLVQSIVPKDGPKIKGSLVHDDIYEKKPEGWTRKRADQLLRALCKAAGVSWSQRTMMYHAVRIGGGGTWDT